MLPRTRAAGRGRSSPNASDGASAQEGQPPLRGRGCSRGRGRGRVAGRGRVGPAPASDTQTQAPDVQVNMGETAVEVLVAELRELRQQLQNVQNTVAGLSGNRAEGADVVANKEQVGAPDQVEPQQNRVAGQRDVYLERFLKLNPPTFCGTDDKEDPQCFIRDVVKIGRAMKCPNLELTELASCKLKGAA